MPIRRDNGKPTAVIVQQYSASVIAPLKLHDPIVVSRQEGVGKPVEIRRSLKLDRFKPTTETEEKPIDLSRTLLVLWGDAELCRVLGGAALPPREDVPALPDVSDRPLSSPPTTDHDGPLSEVMNRVLSRSKNGTR